MVAKLLDRTLLDQVGDKMVEMCGPLAFIAWLHISYVHVANRLLDGALSERVRGRALGNSSSVSRSAFILRFP